MKVSNIKCKPKHSISTMVICGRYMFEFTITKDMKSMLPRKGGASRESSDTFISNTNCQGIEK